MERPDFNGLCTHLSRKILWMVGLTFVFPSVLVYSRFLATKTTNLLVLSAISPYRTGKPSANPPKKRSRAGLFSGSPRNRNRSFPGLPTYRREKKTQSDACVLRLRPREAPGVGGPRRGLDLKIERRRRVLWGVALVDFDFLGFVGTLVMVD